MLRLPVFAVLALSFATSTTAYCARLGLTPAVASPISRLGLTPAVASPISRLGLTPAVASPISRLGLTPEPGQDGGGLARPLNVLFILSDQHSARALGSYGNGFGGLTQSLTPRLDELAEGGTRFENAYCVTPQCMPSRYTILTGRWPHAHGLRVNDVWEPRDAVTFPELARAAGYVTSWIGKHHLLWLSQPGPLVDDHGFDEVVSWVDYRQFCAAAGRPQYADAVVTMPGMPFPMDVTGYTLNENEFHPTGYWAQRAIEFLEARAGPSGDGQPFVLYYGMKSPHRPILPSGPADPNDWAHLHHPFEALELPPNFDKVATTTRLAGVQSIFAGVSESQHKEALSYYYGLVSQVDFNVGRVLDRLEQLGLADETLVVYTADHGELGTEMGSWTKNAGHMDALTRVPLIVRLPGVVRAGAVSDALVSNVDFVRTLLELTGVHAPDAVRAALDGASLAPLLIDGNADTWRDVLCGEAGHPGLGNRHRYVVTRTDKYVFDEEYGEEEYYDLAGDEYERSDLFQSPDPVHQERIAKLRRALEQWWNGEIGHAPPYARSGGFEVPPPAAAFPEPADGAQDVARDVDPRWLPATAADTQEVLLGTEPGQLALFATLPTMAARVNVGSLAPATRYFWRVDGLNFHGRTVGPTWSFTTDAGGAGGPALATAPTPPDRASGVATRAKLTWTRGASSDAEHVSFGPAGALAPLATLAPGALGAFDPGPLAAGVTYEWRVDGSVGGAVTEGDVWSFTTDAFGLAERATPLFPLHLAADVEAGPSFAVRWSAGAGADSHEVYFGTQLPPAPRGNQTAASWSPGALEPGAMYYWRVDEVNALGTRRGLTWRFTVAR